MNEKTKQKAFIFLILAAVMLSLIAASLPRMTLSTGMPLPEIEHVQGTLVINDQKTGAVIPANESLKVAFLAMLTGFLFFYYKIIKQIKWKGWGFILLSISLGILGVGIILFLLFYFSPHSANPVTAKTLWPPFLQVIRSPLGPAPVFLLWIMGFFLLGLIGIIGFRIFTLKTSTDTGSSGSSHLLELEALKAKEAILSGQDYKNVITRCYHQMCLVFEKDREIVREDSMTAEEFAKLLEAAGAPRKSVRELTELFEDVRYGNWKPESGEEQRAIQCFEEIIQYFRKENDGDGYCKV